MTTTETAPAEKPAPPTPIVAGQPRALATLGMTEVGQLRLWAKAQQPNPLEEVRPHLDGLDAPAQRILLELALAELRKPVMFGSPEFLGAMQGGGGIREVLWLSLKRAGSDVDRAASDAAADAMSIDEAADVLAAALGS